MKTNMFVSSFLAAFAIAASALGAQQGRGPGTPSSSQPTGPIAPVSASAAERLQAGSQFSRQLGLSSEQEAQVATIRERQRLEIAALNQNRDLTQEQRREQIAATVRTCDEQIRGLLNQDQLQTMDQIRAQDRERLRTDSIAELLQRRSQLSRELGLSVEQEAQLARIREQQSAEIAALNQNRQLTQEQRRQQISAMRQKYGDQVRAMLKQDQLQKLDQLRDLDRDRDRTRDRKRIDRPVSE